MSDQLLVHFERDIAKDLKPAKELTDLCTKVTDGVKERGVAFLKGIQDHDMGKARDIKNTIRETQRKEHLYNVIMLMSITNLKSKNCRDHCKFKSRLVKYNATQNKNTIAATRSLNVLFLQLRCKTRLGFMIPVMLLVTKGSWTLAECGDGGVPEFVEKISFKAVYMNLTVLTSITAWYNRREKVVDVVNDGSWSWPRCGLSFLTDRHSLKAFSQFGEVTEAENVYLHTAPSGDVGGLSSALAMLMVGSSHVLMPKFEANSTLKAIEKYNVTSFIIIPISDIISLVTYVQ
ncbi:AMP-dependent synthetase/ligase [Artemisia annua]|uniref:AMP-dependent synthetase/ligase n=1 Tax=Artemisia annua TaxID=35608 RepID=A0A2U1LCC6_ARTAN|nr:AMP-dependent synthetase/ligase [Artemisia annua]